MNTSIIGKNIDLSDGIKSAVEGSFETFKKYNLDIISAKAIITCEDKNKRYCVEFLLNIAHNNSVIIKQYDKDTYSSIDEAASRVHKKLRKIHEIEVDHKSLSLGEALASDSQDSFEDNLVSMDIEANYHHIELKDAISILSNVSEQNFLVYTDLEDKVRVLYKRLDSKLGLY